MQYIIFSQENKRISSKHFLIDFEYWLQLSIRLKTVTPSDTIAKQKAIILRNATSQIKIDLRAHLEHKGNMNKMKK